MVPTATWSYSEPQAPEGEREQEKVLEPLQDSVFGIQAAVCVCVCVCVYVLSESIMHYSSLISEIIVRKRLNNLVERYGGKRKTDTLY